MSAWTYGTRFSFVLRGLISEFHIKKHSFCSCIVDPIDKWDYVRISMIRLHLMYNFRPGIRCSITTVLFLSRSHKENAVCWELVALPWSNN